MPSTTVLLKGILIFAHMAFAFSTIALVLMHSGKDAGLSGAFGVGSSQFGGTQVMERNLTRMTIVCAVMLVATTVGLGFAF
jgi:preprotein translocase subunit SecG